MVRVEIEAARAASPLGVAPSGRALSVVARAGNPLGAAPRAAGCVPEVPRAGNPLGMAPRGAGRVPIATARESDARPPQST